MPKNGSKMLAKYKAKRKARMKRQVGKPGAAGVYFELKKNGKESK